MRFEKLALILVVVMLFTIACSNPSTNTTSDSRPASSPAAPAPSATPDELASARANFQKHCVVCHGEKGEGGRKEVEGKRFRVPNLGEGHALKHTDEKFVTQISEGDEEMPAFKEKLSPAEINDLVKFIRKQFQKK